MTHGRQVAEQCPDAPGGAAVEKAGPFRLISFILLVGLLTGLGQLLAVAQDKPDDRYRSPRATVRTLLTAITVAHADPKLIQRAISCLDLSEVPAGQLNAALLATQLEAVFRARDINTQLIPDQVDGAAYVFPEWQGQRMALQKMPDGRWLFDRETVARIPALFAEAQKLLLDRNREAAALNVSPLYLSPRTTVRTLMTAYARRDYDRVLHAMDLDDIPVVARKEVGIQLANKLKQILVRQPRIILQELPDSNFSDPFIWLSEPEGVVELVRFATGDRKGEWVFSKDTVRTIDNLFAAIEDRPYSPEIVAAGTLNYLPTLSGEPELWLRSHLPGWLRASAFGGRYTNFEVFELIGYVLVPLLAFILCWPTNWLLASCVERLLVRLGLTVPRRTIERRLRLTGWFVGVQVLRWGLLLLEPDTVVLIPLLTVLNPLAWVVGVLAVMSIVDLVTDLVELHLASRRGVADFAQMFWPVGSLALKIALLLIMIFRLMEMFSWDVTAVLTGLGIGGLAVALGAQDVLKNLFGSLTLIADRPFLVGESVRIGDHQAGTVEVVGLRSTRIRTVDDTLLIVPNSNLTTTEITNYGKRRFRRYMTRISVGKTVTRDELIEIRDRIRDLLGRHPRTRKDHLEVAIDSLADGKAALGIDVYFEVANREEELAAREALILDVMRLPGDLKITLAPAA